MAEPYDELLHWHQPVYKSHHQVYTHIIGGHLGSIMTLETHVVLRPPEHRHTHIADKGESQGVDGTVQVGAQFPQSDDDILSHVGGIIPPAK